MSVSSLSATRTSAPGDLLGGGRCVLDDALEAGLVDGIIGVGFRHDFISFLFANLFADFLLLYWIYYR